MLLNFKNFKNMLLSESTKQINQISANLRSGNKQLIDVALSDMIEFNNSF